ncbi:unnamed protein product [Linum trigynum]|uniref:RNase H type-1 domain-containing protein n=1 Tax=Linum trigynum TaxID=586398 RepID=A0AAV2FLM3_9ROSI
MTRIIIDLHAAEDPLQIVGKARRKEFKLNSDAWLFHLSGIGLGAIIRDWRGAFKGATTMKEEGRCRPIEVEAEAVLMGIREANIRELSPLIVESDCQVLIRKLSEGEEDWMELGVWCQEIWKLAEVNSRMSRIQVKWVFAPRSANGVAHWLAHSIGVWNNQIVWVDEPPNSLLYLLDGDLGRAPVGPV